MAKKMVKRCVRGQAQVAIFSMRWLGLSPDTQARLLCLPYAEYYVHRASRPTASQALGLSKDG
ncbi:protein of unknown function [Methylocaldum szegediense]|uniref:Uncharacterized protein n=1 Tax=Methylocaldum szegediense TaxID=73780 RepID=A0ABM9I6K2_9GAMM|nr:protein of unknown function [Methylocaldum szegediense]